MITKQIATHLARQNKHKASSNKQTHQKDPEIYGNVIQPQSVNDLKAATRQAHLGNLPVVTKGPSARSRTEEDRANATRPSKECFLEAFECIEIFKKHPLEGARCARIV